MARAPEGHDMRPFEFQGLYRLKKFHILRVGAGPSAFDKMDAELIELPGYLQLITDGKRDAFRLRSIAQRRII